MATKPNGSEWVLRHEVKPVTHNALTSMHYRTRAKWVREWREAFCWLAKAQRIPLLARVEVHGTSHLRSRRSRYDVGADYPSVKAALDGIVDAGVLVDDDPEHVRFIGLHRPVFDGCDALELLIREVST